MGLITDFEQAEAIVATGDADLIALARGILYDPRWPWHAAASARRQVKAPHAVSALAAETASSSVRNGGEISHIACRVWQSSLGIRRILSYEDGIRYLGDMFSAA